MEYFVKKFFCFFVIPALILINVLTAQLAFAAIHANNRTENNYSDIVENGSDINVLYAWNNGEINQYGNVSADGTSVKGAYAYDNGRIYVSGDIIISGDYARGAASYYGGGTINVDGNINLNGSNSRGVYAEGWLRNNLSSVVSVDGNITVVGNEYVYGIYANELARVTVSGDILASGDHAIGARADQQSSVDITGNVTATGDYAEGVCAERGSELSINGNVSVTGGYAIGAASYYADALTTVIGDVSASGIGATAVYTEGYSSLGEGAAAVVTGNISADGSGSKGAHAQDHSTISIDGAITVSGDFSRGAMTTLGSSIDIVGDIDITGNNAAGLLSDGNSIITASGDITISGNSSAGLYANGNSVITASGNITISGDNAHGLHSHYNGNNLTRLSGDITIFGDNAYGSYAEGWLGNGYKAETIIDGNITVYGNGSFGAYCYDNGATSITGNIVVSGDSSRGAVAAYMSYLDIEGDITVSGDNSRALYVNGGGNIDLRNSTVTSGGSNSALLETGSYGSVSATDGSKLYGDIINSNDATDNVALDVVLSGGSSLTGSVKNQGAKSATNLTLSDSGDTWRITGDSSLTNLNMGDATVDFQPSPVFTTLTVEKLNPAGSGTGGSFIMRADIPGISSDQIIVTDSASSGFYDIKVLNVGSAATTGNEILTLATIAFGSNVTFGLTNIVECGAWQYDMNYVQGLPAAPGVGGIDDEWQLKATGRASDPGSGAINSFAGSYLMAYADTQTLIQRMGDLRQSPYGQGLWFRVHGGKFESNSKSYVRGFDMDYGGVQIGYDRKLENKWGGDLYTGIMFGYSKGDLDYHHEGSGEVDSKTLGIYGTYIGRSGFYIDTILKYQWMTNDFDVIDTAGTLVRGQEVDTGGIGASVEFGQRLHVGKGKERGIGWYVEPQVQLSYQRQDGGYFNATNGLHIGVEPFTSILGRLGMLVGYETDKTNFYAKVSKVKEFDGDLTIRSNGVPISESFASSWWVYGIGCTSRINDRNSLYLDIERASGGTFSQPWRVLAGWRMEF